MLTIQMHGGGVWYEYGSGISTKKSDAWNERIGKDNKNLFLHLLEKNLIPEWNYRMCFSDSKTERRLLRLIHYPQSYLKRIFSLNSVKGYEGIDFDINKLKKILEQ